MFVLAPLYLGSLCARLDERMTNVARSIGEATLSRKSIHVSCNFLYGNNSLLWLRS